MIFGMDADGLKPGQSITVDDGAYGYPTRYLHDVPAGEYFVQVVFHKYETFHRADGYTVKLPMDRGEGQHWNLAPGICILKPQKINPLKKGGEPIAISLDQVIAAIPEPGYDVCAAHQDSKRVVNEILGTADISERECAGARGI